MSRRIARVTFDFDLTTAERTRYPEETASGEAVLKDVLEQVARLGPQASFETGLCDNIVTFIVEGFPE